MDETIIDNKKQSFVGISDLFSEFEAQVHKNVTAQTQRCQKVIVTSTGSYCVVVVM